MYNSTFSTMLIMKKKIVGLICLLMAAAAFSGMDVSSARPVLSTCSTGLKSFAMAALVCLASLGANAADSLTMGDFGHKIKLQVAGYTNETTLVNFPVLVRVSEAGIPGLLYDAEYIANSFDMNPPSGQIWTQTSFTAVPEPSSGLLLLVGGGLLLLRRRKADVT